MGAVNRSRSRRSRVGRVARVAAVLVLLAAPMAASATPVHAASIEFGRPSVEGSFDTGLVASQPVTLDGTIDRIEVLATFADSPGPTVMAVPVPAGSGPTTLSKSLGGRDDHILPNTPLRVRWRITADGTTRIGPEVRMVVSDDRFDWKMLSGEVVRVHWYRGDEAFGQHALRIGEREVEETAKLLGVTETQPVDFFIYADRDAFYDALGPGTRENVGGQANSEIRTLFADIAPSSIDDPWVDNVVPHELIHLVFDTAVHNPYHFPPRWLNEGLAVYLSVGYAASDRSAVEDAAKSGDLIPLDGLTEQFPTGPGFGLAYSEAVSAVDYLVREHGQDTLISLVKSYADGKTDDEAFEGAIGMDVAAFDDAWLTDIGAKEPVRYGPKPAPPGPRPSDWGAVAAPSAAPGASGTAQSDVPTGSETTPSAGGPPLGLLVALVGVGAAIALLVVSRARGGAR
jgi:peptidase MA superfamily protein